jgi:DNA helicase-4
VDLVQNYRNPTEILDFASDVIEKCKAKLHKKLIPRKIQDLEEVIPNLVFYRVPTNDEFDFRYKQNEAAIAQIRGLLGMGVSQSEIMVLSRFKFGFADLKEKCQNASDIEVEIRKEGISVKEGIRFMSIHKSKGLEAEYVLLLNVFEGLFGFPPEFNKEMEMQIINPDLPERLDEERRLLFVASTRAKIQCTVFTMKSRESSFLQDNKFYQKHFNKQIESEFTGQIVQETEKGFQIMAHLSPSFTPTFWAPKSVTYLTPLNDGSSLLKIRLEEWWFEKEGENINKSI